MTTYKYTDATNTVVHVIDDDGISRSSMLASLVPEGESIIPADPPSPAELNAPHLAYLASTDWYVTRFIDNGTPIPDDIKVARQAARDAIV